LAWWWEGSGFGGLWQSESGRGVLAIAQPFMAGKMRGHRGKVPAGTAERFFRPLGTFWLGWAGFPSLKCWAIFRPHRFSPEDKSPGKIVDAGLFDEQWKFTTERPK
jgi:hypothetical protein